MKFTTMNCNIKEMSAKPRRVLQTVERRLASMVSQWPVSLSVVRAPLMLLSNMDEKPNLPNTKAKREKRPLELGQAIVI